jgi:hypothetical protein
MAAGAHTISINDPAASGTPMAGQVVLSGTVSVPANAVTSVLYVVDVTNSSKRTVANTSCGDVNGDAGDPDGEAGDVLDCELAAVKALNASLLTSSNRVGVQVGIEAFGSLAQVADLNAAGATFAPPGDTGGEAQPRVITAAESVWHHRILQYNAKSLGTTGITYDDVLETAKTAFASAPSGPKWLFLISDGKTPVNTTETSTEATLADLHNSGIHLSSFAVGDNANCDKNGALAKMAVATGEACTRATTPDSLASQLTGSQPDGIFGVNVTIGDTTVQADVNAIGGWTAAFRLGHGSYTATATATFRTDPTASASRSFVVAASSQPGAPPPGTVAAGPGTVLATAVQINRPKPSRKAVPATITGHVGLPTRTSMKATTKLNGATVLLQGRKYVGGTWTTVARSVVKDGAFSLHWKRRSGLRLLRVELPAYQGLGASSAPVPTANISACRVHRHGSTWSITCHTTAKRGSQALLKQNGHVVDRATVAGGLVKVHASGRLADDVLVVKLSRKKHAHHARLAF